MRILNHILGNGALDGEKSVVALGDGPGDAAFLGFFLHIAAGHVDGEEVLVDVLQDVLVVVAVIVLQFLADDEAQLDFEVQVYVGGAEDGAFVGEEDGGGGFEEVEGLVGALVVEFFDVVGVVAAYADNL